MELKSDSVNFETHRTVNEIAKILQDILNRLKVSSVEEISSGTGALEMFDDRADIQVVAQGADFTSLWAVQVYVLDEGHSRNITLVALGESAFSRAMGGFLSGHTIGGGLKNNFSLKKSITKRDYIATALN